jgi:hypothetical protein
VKLGQRLGADSPTSECSSSLMHLSTTRASLDFVLDSSSGTTPQTVPVPEGDGMVSTPIAGHF